MLCRRTKAQSRLKKTYLSSTSLSDNGLKHPWTLIAFKITQLSKVVQQLDLTCCIVQTLGESRKSIMHRSSCTLNSVTRVSRCPLTHTSWIDKGRTRHELTKRHWRHFSRARCINTKCYWHYRAAGRSQHRWARALSDDDTHSQWGVTVRTKQARTAKEETDDGRTTAKEATTRQAEATSNVKAEKKRIPRTMKLLERKGQFLGQPAGWQVYLWLVVRYRLSLCFLLSFGIPEHL